MFLILFLVFSISAIQAGDVNSTDINALDYNGNVALQLEEDAELEVVVSDELPASLGEISKNQTQLTSPTDTIYYGGNYQVSLIDSSNNATLFNKTVFFSINNIEYSAATDSNGIASVNLKLNPGNYPVMVYFPGDDTYAASNNLSGQVKILTTIKASDITKYYKNSKNYKAIFLDSQGRPLSNKYVSITVNGKKYTQKTDSNGLASFPMDFKPGTYKIIATNPVTGYSLTTTFMILSTVTSSDLKKVKGDNKKFVAKFLTRNGKPLSNRYVKVKINSNVYNYKTNSNGALGLSFNQFKQGKYTVVCYNRDGLSTTSNVYVYNIATTKLATYSYTFFKNETKVVKVKFATNLNDNSKSGQIIKITIGGKTYSQKTDANGEINFKLPSLSAGLYKIECDFYGNEFFKPAYAENFITIVDTSNTKLTVKGTTKFGYGANTPVTVALTAGKVPLSKRTVALVIGGKTYKKTTGLNGLVSVPIDLKIGSHTINYKTNDESKLKGTSGSFGITVFKRSPSKLTWESESSYKDNLQTFKVLLKGSNGKPILGGIIELTIDGETYTRKTASDGYATFKTSVAIGKYKVVVKFLGNNDFLPSATSKVINVELSKFKTGINEKNAISYLSAYGKSSRYCQVNNGKIKSVVSSLTSGLNNKIDKAKAIFNYVRDNIAYDYYYDSHKGALGALNSKRANCVDQASLLVAMYRTAGFKARYVHGTCVFSDGVYGHVWTQVLIDDTWVVGDSINTKNSLGKIKNWNVNTFKLKAKYVSIPF